MTTSLPQANDAAIGATSSGSTAGSIRADDDSIRVLQARQILTMNPSRPTATHVAIRQGRVLAVGSLEEIRAWTDAPVDDRYADAWLMPGLVEGHSHLAAGGLWRYTFVGFHDRLGPDGTLWSGCRTFEDVISRLIDAERGMTDPAEPLLAWGLDPIFFGTARMSVLDLDRVSTTRPVVIMHANFHVMNVNSPALARAGMDRDTDIEGFARFSDGRPTGELQEFAAMFPINRMIQNAFMHCALNEAGLHMFGQLAIAAGVTTATDLVNDLSEDSLGKMRAATDQDDYPVRLVPALAGFNGGVEKSIERAKAAAATSTDKLRLGLIKIVADGSIQSFTARLRWPGYFDGHPNGIWIFPPAELRSMIAAYHQAGLQMHIHTNGDEATEVVLDAIEAALDQHPRADHRHTLQHCQMADTAQFRRMANLRMCVNLFSNHIYYWGDAHYSMTMGPDRAERIDACASALRQGVPMAIHSDAPVTPLGPLFTAWCAVNRQTSSGRVLGPGERISVADALRAITLGAAYTLRLDHLIGSIEVGKFADFCVLEQDPTAVPPEALKDLRILGTVIGGRSMVSPRERSAATRVPT